MSDEDLSREPDFLGLSATVRGFVPGQRLLDRYVLRLVLDWSYRGVCWLAVDEHLQSEVELKFLPENLRLDKVSLEKIRQKALQCQQLRHPHIARLYDLIDTDSFAAFSMEYVDGDTLPIWRKCQPNGVFEIAHIYEWTVQLLDALDYAHVEAKLPHGGLHPDNLIGDEGGELKLIDFGIARCVEDALCLAGGRDLADDRLVYMSPQLARGQAPSEQDDIYAVGAVLYELLTSRPVFLETSEKMLEKVQFEVPPYMTQRLYTLGIKAEHIPDEWELTVAACLAKEPAARPKSIAAVAQRLGFGVAPITVTTTKSEQTQVPQPVSAPPTRTEQAPSTPPSQSTTPTATTEAKIVPLAPLVTVPKSTPPSAPKVPPAPPATPEQIKPSSTSASLSSEAVVSGSTKPDELAPQSKSTESAATSLPETKFAAPVVTAPVSAPPLAPKVPPPPPTSPKQNKPDPSSTSAPASPAIPSAASKPVESISQSKSTEQTATLLPETKPAAPVVTAPVSAPPLAPKVPPAPPTTPEQIKPSSTSAPASPAIPSAASKPVESISQSKSTEQTATLLPETKPAAPVVTAPVSAPPLAPKVPPAPPTTPEQIKPSSTSAPASPAIPSAASKPVESISQSKSTEPAATPPPETKPAAPVVTAPVSAPPPAPKVPPAPPTSPKQNKPDPSSTSAPASPAIPSAASKPVESVSQSKSTESAATSPRETAPPGQVVTAPPSATTLAAAAAGAAPTSSPQIKPGTSSTLAPASRGVANATSKPIERRPATASKPSNPAGPVSAAENPPPRSAKTKRWRKEGLLVLSLVILFVLDALGLYFFRLGPEAERLRLSELALRAATAEAEKQKAEKNADLNDREKALLVKAKQEAELRAAAAEQAARQALAEAEKTKQSALQELSTVMSPVVGRPWINSQGVKLVPAGTTGVLFSVWDVRVKDYRAFVAATGHEWPKAPFDQTENDPAVMVSWDDANAYCDWLTKKEQAEGRLVATEAYRLPTDAEWSKAVGLNEPDAGTPRDRNGDVRNAFPWGDQWFPPNLAGNYAELLTHDGFPKTSPVGSFRANTYGLYDMGGNVWQWCEDRFDYAHDWRVLRGASWVDHDEEALFSSCRSAAEPVARDGSSGFRVVLVVSP